MPALLVQHSIIDELIDGRARLKGGIQLDERLGPEQPRAPCVFHFAGTLSALPRYAVAAFNIAKMPADQRRDRGLAPHHPSRSSRASRVV